jgi:hypothetical protein
LLGGPRNITPLVRVVGRSCCLGNTWDVLPFFARVQPPGASRRRGNTTMTANLRHNQIADLPGTLSCPNRNLITVRHILKGGFITRSLPCLLAGSLGGCASRWTNPQFADAGAQAEQLAKSDGYCTQVAMGDASTPPVQIAQQPAGYAFQGQSTTLGPTPSQSRFSGQVTPTENPASAFAGGMANGMAMGAILGARRSQNRIHDGCMITLGWRKEQ